MAGNTLGVYFGPANISLIEGDGKKIINSIQIQRSTLSSGDLEEKVPEEVRIAAVFKEELRKNNISAKEVSICLSGKDLIIRTFEIPILPANEIPSVINFEVKKYIPFKVEDLVSDSQVLFDKANRRNQVLYVGVKKDTLDKYLSIMSQLGLKVNAIEYSGFSVLRFLRLANLDAKGIVAVLSMDLNEEDEINFTVLERGFPLFSRDITLIGGQQELPKPQDASLSVEKIKTEIRVSLDYYHRKFPAKKIENTFLICNIEHSAEMEAFLNESGLRGKTIDTSKPMGKRAIYSLSSVKAFGASLSKSTKINIKLDILSSRAKAKAQKLPAEAAQFELASLLSGLVINPKAVIAGIFICALSFAYSLYLKLPVQNELEQVIASLPKVPGISPEAGTDELNNINQDYEQKINALKNIITRKFYLTETFNQLPRITPSDMKIISISFRNDELDKSELVINGSVYLGESDKELKLVNAFAASLKSDPAFQKEFTDVAVTNIEQRPEEKIMVTMFTIICKG